MDFGDIPRGSNLRRNGIVKQKGEERRRRRKKRKGKRNAIKIKKKKVSGYRILLARKSVSLFLDPSSKMRIEKIGIRVRGN